MCGAVEQQRMCAHAACRCAQHKVTGDVMVTGHTVCVSVM